MSEINQNSDKKEIIDILFQRYAKITFTDTSGTNEPFLVLETGNIDFNATVNYDLSENSNKAKIDIYNLPVKYETLLKNSNVSISAGYKLKNSSQEFGHVFTGIVEKFGSKKNGNTIQTEIFCSEINKIYKDLLFQISIKSNKNSKNKTGIKASTIINKIIKRTQNLEPSLTLKTPLILYHDIEYERSKSFNGNLKNIFSRIAQDTKSIYIFNGNSQVEFIPYNHNSLEEIYFDYNRVLEILTTDRGFSITMIFDHRMKVGKRLKGNKIENRFTRIFPDSTPHIITKIDHSINTSTGAHTTTIDIDSLYTVLEKEQNEKLEERRKKEQELNKIMIDIT